MNFSLHDQIEWSMVELDAFLNSDPSLDTMDWLQSKWDSDQHGINADYSFEHYGQSGYRYEQIPVHLIVAGSDSGTWGDLTYRRSNYARIANAALDAYRSGNGYDEWLKKMTEGDTICLAIAASPKHGSLYRIGINGNHRLHVLKAMGITAPIRVEVANTFEKETISFHRKFMVQSIFDMLVRHEHLERIEKDDHGNDQYRILRPIPTWLMMNQDAESIHFISSRYKEYYPEFGNDELERILLDLESIKNEMNYQEPVPDPVLESAPALEIKRISVWSKLASLFR